MPRKVIAQRGMKSEMGLPENRLVDQAHRNNKMERSPSDIEKKISHVNTKQTKRRLKNGSIGN